MITAESYLGQACKIDAPETVSTRNAYELGKSVARRKVELVADTQKILDELMRKKVSMDLSKIKELQKN